MLVSTSLLLLGCRSPSDAGVAEPKLPVRGAPLVCVGVCSGVKEVRDCKETPSAIWTVTELAKSLEKEPKEAKKESGSEQTDGSPEEMDDSEFDQSFDEFDEEKVLPKNWEKIPRRELPEQLVVRGVFKSYPRPEVVDLIWLEPTRTCELSSSTLPAVLADPENLSDLRVPVVYRNSIVAADGFDVEPKCFLGPPFVSTVATPSAPGTETESFSARVEYVPSKRRAEHYRCCSLQFGSANLLVRLKRLDNDKLEVTDLCRQMD